MDNLDSSVVHRNLDAKLKIGGLEALDLLAVLIFSAIMGVFFDGGLSGFIFIFLVPITLLIFLYFIKRNKPEGFLKDFLRFSLSRGFFSASEPMKNRSKLCLTIIKGNQNHG
jgi:hypothetical protein